MTDNPFLYSLPNKQHEATAKDVTDWKRRDEQRGKISPLGRGSWLQQIEGQQLGRSSHAGGRTMQSRGADGSMGRRAAAAEEGVTTGGRPTAEGGATGAWTARAGRRQRGQAAASSSRIRDGPSGRRQRRAPTARTKTASGRGVDSRICDGQIRHRRAETRPDSAGSRRRR